MHITIIGTGNVGKKLGALLADAGHHITFGSRSPRKTDMPLNIGIEHIEDAIPMADIILFAIPYTAYADLLPSLREKLSGKIVIDVSNPLHEDWSPLMLGEANSAGETVAKLLPDSHVVKAFNTIFADMMTSETLNNNGNNITSFIAGNDQTAINIVEKLSSDIGTDPVIVGTINNARYLEAMAHLNIQLAVGQNGGTHAGFVYVRNSLQFLDMD